MRTLSILLLLSLATSLASPLLAQKQPNDDLIYNQVRRRLASDPDVKGAMIEVEVKAGHVTLRGRVKTEKARQKADKLARKVSGVKKVANELKVAP